MSNSFHFRNLKKKAAKIRTMPMFAMSRSQKRSLKNSTSTQTTTAIKTTMHTGSSNGLVITQNNTALFHTGQVEHLYQFGIRGMIGKKKINKNYSLFPMTHLTDSNLNKLVGKLDRDLKYYLSLDIDVLDPSIVPGTGTTVPFGMRVELLKKLLSLIISRVDIVGFDIVEVNPMIDQRNLTSELALSLVLHLLSEIDGKK